MNDLECFYAENLKADGGPFLYNMINYTGIAGGIGPTGSVKSKNKNVEIPRSKKAQNIHTIAFVIKLIFFLVLLVILGMGLINFTNTYQIILFSVFFLLFGGGIVQLLYQITKVKSKLFHSSNYSVIKKLEDKGYTRGGHVMIASTPLGSIVFISRWIF